MPDSTRTIPDVDASEYERTSLKVICESGHGPPMSLAAPMASMAAQHDGHSMSCLNLIGRQGPGQS